MSITAFFKQIGAPLANQRWSWGATQDDGTVVLRVWQDQTRKVDGVMFFRGTDHLFFKDERDNLGYKERNSQIKLVENGARCLMIVCIAKDPNAHPREIASFIKDDLFVAGSYRHIDGETWLELSDRKPWRELVL